MIISRKHYEEAIRKAVEEAITKREEARYMDERIRFLDERMNDQFREVWRRMRALEKKTGFPYEETEVVSRDHF